MRIDAHQHYWKLDRGDYGWLTPESGPIYRDYLPPDLKPHLDQCGIGRTVAVQAAPTVDETRFLLSLADQWGSIAGVVGWLDLESSTFERDLEELCAHPKFKGIRPMIQDLPKDDWIIQPRVLDALKFVAEKGIAFDFLTYPRHLPLVVQVLEQVPGLRSVIDHISKPPIARGQLQPWADRLKEVAMHPNVYCKLSGMITEADHKNWKPEDLKPFVDHALEVFGPERVMYGSDWPVCLLAGSYEQVYRTLANLLEGRLDAAEEAAVFGGNAARFYRLYNPGAKTSGNDAPVAGGNAS